MRRTPSPNNHQFYVLTGRMRECKNVNISDMKSTGFTWEGRKFSRSFQDIWDEREQCMNSGLYLLRRNLKDTFYPESSFFPDLEDFGLCLLQLQVLPMWKLETNISSLSPICTHSSSSHPLPCVSEPGPSLGPKPQGEQRPCFIICIYPLPLLELLQCFAHETLNKQV